MSESFSSAPIQYMKKFSLFLTPNFLCPQRERLEECALWVEVLGPVKLSLDPDLNIFLSTTFALYHPRQVFT